MEIRKPYDEAKDLVTSLIELSCMDKIDWVKSSLSTENMIKYEFFDTHDVRKDRYLIYNNKVWSKETGHIYVYRLEVKRSLKSFENDVLKDFEEFYIEDDTYGINQEMRRLYLIASLIEHKNRKRKKKKSETELFKEIRKCMSIDYDEYMKVYEWYKNKQIVLTLHSYDDILLDMNDEELEYKLIKNLYYKEKNDVR